MRTNLKTQIKKTDTPYGDNRKIRAHVLREAAKIAEAEQSPLAVDIWNGACRRIQQILGAEAAKIERS